MRLTIRGPAAHLVLVFVTTRRSKNMRAVALMGIVLSLSASTSAIAQSGVGVEVDEVIDNRMSDGMLTGSLELRVKLKGSGLEKASGARILVKDARDDRGTALAGSSDPPDFTPREYNSGTLNFSLKQPARAASKVHVKGTVELFVPSRDPAATVKVPNALSKLDQPLSLKGANVTLTLMSREKYAAALKARKITDKDIEQIRAEGKAHGASDKEIELAIGLAKAMEGLDSEPPEGAVLLSGKKSDFDRIYRVEILGSDGKPIDIGGRSTSSRGEDSLMTLQPSLAPPKDAALQFYVLTAKSKVAIPFEMDVQLP